MAKKAKTSARSKGYRKTEQKKPFLTKKEIIALVVIVAVIALAILLFNLLYDDGSLEMVDGVAQTENLETSLITSESIGDEVKHFKVGEVGEIAGYTRERSENTVDANRASYIYRPEDEDSPVDYLRISAGGDTPEQLATTALWNYSANPTYFGTAPNGVQETEIDGRTVYYIISTNEYVPQTTEETADTDAEATDAEDAAEATEETAAEESSTEETATEETAAEATAQPDAEPATEDASAAEAATDAEAETDAEAATEAETAGPYACEQLLTAYTASDMNDNYAIAFGVVVSGETETAVTAEELAAYTESLYLSEEELLDHLTLALEAVYPLTAEE
ncbi:MAG TPA: hypothetical protein IAA71_04050 [Candidatus Pullichristensenella stercoripullorum]|nr:hypothetical protein [Candidatus Pullichristensenella stercoripullorum]